MIRSFFYCWLALTLGVMVSLSEAASWGQVFIVKYHDIPNPDVMTSYMDVAPDNFKDHIEFIDRQGYHVVSLAAIAEWIESGTALPPKAIGICFDDNYIGNYENAFPILAAHRFHGTFFVHTGYVGVMTSKDHADWEELQKAEDSGFISVESHSVTHPTLTELDLDRLRYELVESKKAIEANLRNKTCRLIVYPGGAQPGSSYDERVIEESIRAGYRAGFKGEGGANYGSEPLFEINRVDISHSITLEKFKTIIEFAGSDPESPIMIDNQSKGFSAQGEWIASSTGFQHYATDFLAAEAKPVADATAVFTPEIGQGGLYRISTWYTDASPRCSEVEYIVEDAKGTHRVKVDQTRRGGTWHLLGEYRLEAGDSNSVSISNRGKPGESIVADAMKFEPLNSSTRAD